MKFSLISLLIIFLSSCSFDWSYDGKTGPQNWGDLKDGRKYRFCKIGYNQSPIDVTEKFNRDDLKFFYQNSGIAKKNQKYALEIDFFERDYLKRGRKRYYIRSLVFHHPSEHLIKGESLPLEMQIYHKSDDEQWLAIAIFLTIGQENKDFAKLIDFIDSGEEESKFDLSNILKSNQKFFYYDGSFTTPPCKEGVKWYVAKNSIKISKEQMNFIIKNTIYSKSNARPIQKFHPEKF